MCRIGISLLLACCAAAQQHPLDPLTKAEIASAVEILKSSGKLDASARLPVLRLNEPAKADVLRWKSGDPLHREAFAVVWQRTSNRTAEAVIDLDA
jgi:primary-amine oxidase